METILFLSRTLPPRVVSEAAPAFRIRPMAGRAELARVIVQEPPPLCVLLQEESPGADLVRFLDALCRTFPRLPIGLVATGPQVPPSPSLGGHDLLAPGYEDPE